ncbi:hypothetical protein [Deinococcus sp. PEB2-63]
MREEVLLVRAQEMTTALRAGEPIWGNDVLHLWEWLYGYARDTEGEQALAWAEVAFALVSACPDCWREPLSIRLLMIARFGPQDGHPLLDAQVWTADALKLIPWPPDEYRSVVENSERQDDTQLDAMAHVNNVLELLSQLAKFLTRPLYPDLQSWMEVRAALRMI